MVLAAFYTWFQEEQGLENVRCIGFSMGGWLAAEMAATCHHAFSKLMLVDAAGIKPQKGEITDIFIMFPADPYGHFPATLGQVYLFWCRSLTVDLVILRGLIGVVESQIVDLGWGNDEYVGDLAICWFYACRIHQHQHTEGMMAGGSHFCGQPPPH